MSTTRTTLFVGNFEHPAAWAFKCTFTPRPAVNITGKTPVLYATNDEDSSDTFSTANVSFSQNNTTGVITLTIPASVLTVAKSGRRYKVTVGFGSIDDPIAEFTIRLYTGGRST